MKKKIIAVIACITMVSILLPQTAFAAGESTLQLNTGGIADQDSVYYGKYGTKYPTIEWKVLDADKTNTDEDGMFLITKDALGTGSRGNVMFNTDNNNNYYQGSNAQGWCVDFCNGLDALEQSAIIETTKSDSEFTSGSHGSTFFSYDNILNRDKVFFLSAEEVSNIEYFANGDARKASYKDDNGIVEGAWWWLRSGVAATVDTVGLVIPDPPGVIAGSIYLNDTYAARPAFNLNPNSVLFSSAAVGGKSVAGMDTGLTAVSATAPTAWKLTLLDTSRNNFSAKMTAFNKDTATISYENASVGDSEYVSAIITDKDINDADCNIKYYGRLKNTNASADTNGTAAMSLEGKYADSDKVYIFSEQYNGDKKTDYASPLKEVIIDKSLVAGSDDNPNTGDDRNIGLWIALAVLGLVGTSVLSLKRREENN